MAIKWKAYFTIVAECEKNIVEEIEKGIKTLLKENGITNINTISIEPYPKFDNSYRMIIEASDPSLADKYMDILSYMSEGWEMETANDECYAIWNKSNEVDFFHPAVFWANIQLSKS